MKNLVMSLLFVAFSASAQSPYLVSPNGKYLGNPNNNKYDPNSVMYRMWFLFLRLGLDCEDNNIPIVDYVNNKNIKVKVNKKLYKEWDLDRVRNDTFDSWWNDKRSMLIESKPIVVDEIIENENSIYLRIDKRSKIEDVVKELRTIIEPPPSFTSKFGIQKQHKYIHTHLKYNVFVWK